MLLLSRWRDGYPGWVGLSWLVGVVLSLLFFFALWNRLWARLALRPTFRWDSLWGPGGGSGSGGGGG